VQGDFATVVWVVCAIGIVVAFVSLVGIGKTWDELGKGGLVMERDLVRGHAQGSAAARAERDIEIRQLLEARNARRARRGEPPIDIEAELKRLTTPAIDDELRAEIRDLVGARNARRARTGKPPLDVEAEIEREIAGLHGLGL
jgi:hypothetical protein